MLFIFTVHLVIASFTRLLEDRHYSVEVKLSVFFLLPTFDAVVVVVVGGGGGGDRVPRAAAGAHSDIRAPPPGTCWSSCCPRPTCADPECWNTPGRWRRRCGF